MFIVMASIRQGAGNVKLHVSGNLDTATWWVASRMVLLLRWTNLRLGVHEITHFPKATHRCGSVLPGEHLQRRDYASMVESGTRPWHHRGRVSNLKNEFTHELQEMTGRGTIGIRQVDQRTRSFRRQAHAFEFY